MSTERDEREQPDFVHVGPGTLAGRYLRRFWQPVYLASALGPGEAKSLRILGEDFAIYRTENGAPQVVASRCPHRLTALSTGRVAGETIQCRYHGWRFDREGQCVEQPGEPVPFCSRITLPVYPTCEQLGFIFAYLGESPAPPPPSWPEMEGAPVPEWSPDDAGYLFDAQLSSVEMIPCNYFQAMENIMDDVHVAFAHQDTYINTTARRGIPKVTAEETSFGLTQVLDRGAWTDKIHLVMPNISYLTHPWVIPEELRERVKTNLVRSLVWYVPIDDESFYHFRVGLASVLSIREYASLHPRTRHLWPVVADEINAVVSGRKTMKDVAGHPQLVRIQDGVCLAGQGRIVDRSNERLGRSDVALIRLRKIWTRELRALAAGEPLTPFGRPEPDPVMRIERAATGVEAVSV